MLSALWGAGSCTFSQGNPRCFNKTKSLLLTGFIIVAFLQEATGM